MDGERIGRRLRERMIPGNRSGYPDSRGVARDLWTWESRRFEQCCSEQITQATIRAPQLASGKGLQQKLSW